MAVCKECAAVYPALSIRLAASLKEAEVMRGYFERKLKKRDLAVAFDCDPTTIQKYMNRTNDRVSSYCATKHGET